MVCGLNLAKVAGPSVRQEYLERANTEFGHLRFRIIDLGQHACSTTGACFWLCLAAGLKNCNWQIDPQALPGLQGYACHLEELRGMSVHELDGARPAAIQHTPLGLFAYHLRQYM